MSIITAMRMVAGLSGGTMTTAQLTTALATPAGAAGWKAAVHSPSMARQLVQEPTARTAWMASTEAVRMALLSREFMLEWFDHKDALDKLMTTPSTVTAMLASSEARTALWGSDKALRALGANPSALTIARSSADASPVVTLTYNSNTPASARWFAPNFGRIITLGWGGSTNWIEVTGIRDGSRQPAIFNAPSWSDATTPIILPLEGTLTTRVEASTGTSYAYVRYLRVD